MKHDDTREATVSAMNPSEPRQSPSQGRLLTLLEQSRIARVLVALAALIGALSTLVALGGTAYRFYDGHFRWAARTEKVIESLRANVTTEEFDNRLGSPRIVAPSPSGNLTQRLYQGRGFWVQAITDSPGTVRSFAVTICDARLSPSWKVWNSHDRYEAIELGRTTIANGLSVKPSGYSWFFSGATANTFAFAFYGGTNPTNYQSYAWGYNDACLDDRMDHLTEAQTEVLRNNAQSGPPAEGSRLPSPTSVLDPSIADVFHHLETNTFAIFGIDQSVTAQLAELQIGVDRILVRTLVE